MGLIRTARKSKRGFDFYRAAVMCVVVVSVLWARITPPSLPHSYSSSSFHSLADHDHRQSFAHEDSPWTIAPGSMSGTPIAITSPAPISAATHFVEIVTDGWHYNRPPPLS